MFSEYASAVEGTLQLPRLGTRKFCQVPPETGVPVSGCQQAALGHSHILHSRWCRAGKLEDGTRVGAPTLHGYAIEVAVASLNHPERTLADGAIRKRAELVECGQGAGREKRKTVPASRIRNPPAVTP